MRKILLCFVFVIILCSCTTNNESTVKKNIYNDKGEVVEEIIEKYNSENQLTKVIIGNEITTMEYIDGDLVKQVFDDFVVEGRYNEKGQLVENKTYIDEKLLEKTEYRYDNGGNRVYAIRTNENENKTIDETFMKYDNENQLIEKITESEDNENKVFYEYNEDGKVIKSAFYIDNMLISEVDSVYQEGLLISNVTKNENKVINIVEYQYNEKGKIVKEFISYDDGNTFKIIAEYSYE